MGHVAGFKGFLVLVGPKADVLGTVSVDIDVVGGGVEGKEGRSGGLGGVGVAGLYGGLIDGGIQPDFLGVSHQVVNQRHVAGILGVVLGADAQEVPTVAEYTVVGPVGGEGAHGGYRNVVDQEHDDREDGQSGHAVGDHPVELIRGGQPALMRALEATLEDGRHVIVTLVDDDGLGVVVHDLLGLPDILLDVGEDGGIQVQLLQHLVVPLEDLDGVPSLTICGHAVDGGLLDVGQGVLHLAREDVMGNIAAVLGGLDGQLNGLVYAGILQSRDFHGGTAHAVGQTLQVDLVALLAEYIHHVDGHDHGDAQLGELGGEVEVALQVGAVDDVEDGVGALHDQVVAGHHLL